MGFLKFNDGNDSPGRPLMGFILLSTIFCNFWPAAGRLPEAAGEHVDHRFPETACRQSSRFITSAGLMPRVMRNTVSVADDLAARRHLDNVAEEFIDFGISARNFRPAVCGLPILAACSLRLVYWPPGISWRYTSAVPDSGDVTQNGAYISRIFSQQSENSLSAAKIESPGATRGACCQRGNDGIEVRLAGGTRHGRMRWPESTISTCCVVCFHVPEAAATPLVSCGNSKWMGIPTSSLQRLYRGCSAA